MDRFLATLNKLQDVFTTAGVSCSDIDLPQIVVVGSQSAGKSSVLESIAKQNFLPRGSGIVTRRPLVLQMIKQEREEEKDGVMRHTWAKFLHSEDKVFTDMDRIQQEIIDDTVRICGKDRGISDKAIHLKLHSTKTPSLTLVDLPGLTKIAVGDQPKDIDRKIEKLVRDYISRPNSIILAVSPGNVDIANSDSLKLAREVDPDGSRTLAVVTKCDLMERGKEAHDVLEGSKVGMKLGLIGVINRNNEMLQRKVPIETVVEMEERYFQDTFPDLADRMGTRYLSNQLCDILISHLKKCLPEVSEKITQQQEKHRSILEEVGEESADPRQALVSLLGKFTEAINQSMDGKFTFSEDDSNTAAKGRAGSGKFSAGAELFKVFKSECIDRLSSIKADKDLGNIKELVENTGGIQPALFIPDGVFNNLVSKQLKLLDGPSYNAVEKSHGSIKKSLERIAIGTLGKHPNLASEVTQIATQELVEQMKETKNFIKQYLSNEHSYINTNHPEFIERYEVAADMFRNSADALKSKKATEAQEIKASNMTYMKTTGLQHNSTAFDKLMSRYAEGEKVTTEARSDNEAELLLKLIIHYFCIVRGQLVDVLLKAIMRYMVRDLTTNLPNKLIKSLYTTDDKIRSLVQECDQVNRKRNSSSKMLGVLAKAENLISDIAIGKVPDTKETETSVQKPE